jgi:DNA-binding CsgD family transcriptional regulator
MHSIRSSLPAALPFDDAIALALTTAVPHAGEAAAPLSAGGVDLLSDSAARAGPTPREIEVLRLLVARMTDNEIADNLSISPRTVAPHGGRIRDKLGVHSRRAAAEVAVRDGHV